MKRREVRATDGKERGLSRRLATAVDRHASCAIAAPIWQRLRDERLRQQQCQIQSKIDQNMMDFIRTVLCCANIGRYTCVFIQSIIV